MTNGEKTDRVKKYSNLWNKITAVDNFKQAYKNATKGKKFYTEVREIEKYGVDRYLNELLEEVKTGNYEVSKYEIFHRMTGGKDFKEVQSKANFNK